MLALATGWQPDTLATLPGSFRAACHWVLYGRAIVGDEGLVTPESSPGASLEERAAVAKVQIQHAELREVLFPEGD